MIRLALLLCCMPGAALGHGDAHAESETHALVLIPLACAAFVYLKGLAALKQARFASAPRATLRAAAFMVALLAIALALTGPLHDWAERSFAAHMIEHEMLIVVAAPLLVVARPSGVLLWAFTRPMRQALVRGLRVSGLVSTWRACSNLHAATVLHGAALWIWHVPVLFDSALRIEAVHWLQHATFLLTGVWFWQAVLSAVGRKQMALAIVDLFATTLHMGLLGGLLALARRPLYASISGGVDPLQDQRLAGLIMWVPGCLLYAIAALLIAARMLRPETGLSASKPNYARSADRRPIAAGRDAGHIAGFRTRRSMRGGAGLQ
jgi:cytochrome c oxidase assembly factor CtaG